MEMPKINVYLKKLGQDIFYGELNKMFPRVDKKLDAITKTERIVAELNKLLPNACVEQKTMYYYYKEEN